MGKIIITSTESKRLNTSWYNLTDLYPEIKESSQYHSLNIRLFNKTVDLRISKDEITKLHGDWANLKYLYLITTKTQSVLDHPDFKTLDTFFNSQPF